jgi:hypothetical protein
VNKTITEALADFKTTQARLGKKQRAIVAYVVRDSRLRDPLEKKGGSETYVEREIQSYKDLLTKLVTIRTKIQEANLANNIEVSGERMSVAEWLTWRREAADHQRELYTALISQIERQRQQQDRLEEDKRADIVVNLDEDALRAEIETTEEILGTLDGKLSLFNATVTVDV